MEDNAFFLLRTACGRVAFLHASWTEWKNLFSFEYSGRCGKLEIAGLGGSYGTERLAHYQMLPGMGPPETTIYEYPAADDSWEAEMAGLLGRHPAPAHAFAGHRGCTGGAAHRRADPQGKAPVIITRSPSRISLGGGGTDLPSYYRQHGGFVIAAAIDKYVYITLHQTFVEEAIIKYSQTERVQRIEDIHHPLIREALLLTGVPPEGLEIASMSDIPAFP